MRKYIKYLLVVPLLAAVLVAVPASNPAEANGNFGVSLSFGVPLYYPYPAYAYPAYAYPAYAYPAYPVTWGYYRPYGYWGGYYGYRSGYAYPRHRHYSPRHYSGHRGYDRRGHGRW